MRKEYTKKYKTKMVEKYKKSNTKVSNFCRESGIPISTFNRWLLEDKITSENTMNFGEINIETLNESKTDIKDSTLNNKKTNEIKLIMPDVEICFKSKCSKKILQPILEAILID